MNNIKKKIFLIPTIIGALSLSSLVYMNYTESHISKIDYPTFLKNSTDGNISKVVFNADNTLSVTLKDGSKYISENPNSPTFKEELLKKGVDATENPTKPLSKTIPAGLLTASVLAFIFLAFSKGKVGAKSMSSLDAIDFSQSAKLDFTGVAGNEEAKESVKDIVDFLKNPEKYEKYGARMPKGIILYGEPGTGKTLMAKAVAGEAKVPFYAISGSDFVQMYVGVGAARVRSLFKKAKAKGKAVIFIDEIDAIGKKRSSGNNSGGSDERDQTLNALLTEMSGFAEKEGIVVMAATNRLDTLDSALLRPGRFDRHIEITLPDVNAREKILSLYFKNKPHKDIDIKELAQKTTYFSGAKLESLVNEAAILAAKDNSEYILNNHLEEAYSIVIAGHEKTERSHIKDKDREITAYHESGHAMISMLLMPEDTVSKVTIIPTTKGAGGYTLTIPEDKSYQSYDYLRKRVMVFLGGRATEEIIFGVKNITTGAYNDLMQCTNIIKNMVTEYGMGESLGLLKLSDLGNLGSSYGNQVVEECKKILDELYDETKNLLNENIEVLHSMSKHLLEKEVLHKTDLENYNLQLNN
ncbi:cell division protease FtsH [Clostridium cavendishii DSM 21758]|uniref:ATP-dependent zinc metalloprotease FtsH n=1 Tax=Clostridium cavendishii DSM 21758 TaxID=1121302 RepID=A0A1M6CL91_9CLOT|nr:FtsH/Yme1/Tma family ATP-dependent metallopeptidase [Clostridium cavendishii]SHI61750.1 cell division protease FtsH [Clostridium cavendishii DSM 21758]